MHRTRDSLGTGWLGRILVLAGICTLGGIAVSPMPVQAIDCNGLIDLETNFGGGPEPLVIPDTRAVRVRLGTGLISGGTGGPDFSGANQLKIDRLRFELDCANAAFIGCPDDGNVVSFQN